VGRTFDKVGFRFSAGTEIMDNRSGKSMDAEEATGIGKSVRE